MQIKPLLGEDAQAIRKRCGFTQGELGVILDRSRVQIGRYEKVGVILPTLVALAYRGLDAIYKENNES